MTEQEKEKRPANSQYTENLMEGGGGLRGLFCARYLFTLNELRRRKLHRGITFTFFIDRNVFLIIQGLGDGVGVGRRDMIRLGRDKGKG